FYLRKLLSNSPEVGYMVVSRRYTDLERRVAFFVYPEAAPALRELIDASKQIADAWAKHDPVDTSVKNAIETLGVSASTLLRVTWSLLKKLLVQPVVPLRFTVTAFAESEAHGALALRKMLMSLVDEPTPLRPRAGPLYAEALAFLHSYYRGSLAYPTGTTHSVATLASLLDDVDYVWSDELVPVTPALLTKQVDVLRDRLLRAIADALQGGELALDSGWEKQVLPPLSAYEGGRLLPVPSHEQAVATAAIPRAQTPAPTQTPVRSEEVHSTLARFQLTYGLPLVFDLERSHGTWLFDSQTGKEYLDAFTCFASWPIGYIHPKMAAPAFRAELLRA